MNLRLAEDREAQVAMELIDIAKAHLKEQGIDQWQDGYPNFDSILEDIQLRKAYFLEEKGEILGYVFVDCDGDPVYQQLDGHWAYPQRYAAVHRVAFSANARGKGYSQALFSCIEALVLSQGCGALRMDTHAQNKKMQHVLQKNGFLPRGIVQLTDGERIAFEKVLRRQRDV